ncbi:MAG: hypothetical protein U0736_03365 [Gemmataceae bacterium]
MPPPPPGGLAEFFELLARIDPGDGPRKLQFDLARDAAVDLFHRITRLGKKLQQRLERATERRHAVRDRHRDLLEHLARGSLLFSPAAEVTPTEKVDQLVADYKRLRKRTFPVLANMLHAAGGGPDRVYLTLLTDEVLARGECILVEYLVLHAGQTRTADQDRRFVEELRGHLVGRVNRVLARRTGYHITPEVGAHLNTLVQVAVEFLWDLLHTNPPLRLYFADPGSPFDPERHERLSGRMPRHPRIVRGTLFPGLVRYGPARTLLAPVRVSTRRISRSAPPPSDTDG